MLSGIFAICAQIRKLPRSFLYVRKYLNIFSQKMSKWLRIQIKIYLSRMFFYAQSTGTVYYMGMVILSATVKYTTNLKVPSSQRCCPVTAAVQSTLLSNQLSCPVNSVVQSTLLSSQLCCPVNSAVQSTLLSTVSSQLCCSVNSVVQ